MALAWQGVTAQNQTVWLPIKPDKAPQPVKVMVRGRQLNYYPLDKGVTIELTVQGPETLRVLSRVEFDRDTTDEKSYYVRYERGDGKKGHIGCKATATAGAILADSQSVHLGNARNAYIEVSAGQHIYKFSQESKDKDRLYLRFYHPTTDMEAQSQNVVFTPTKYTAAVNLIIKEERSMYYRVGPQDSLNVSVIGPTTMQVHTRLEFDATMVTDQKFLIRVYEDGRPKQIIPFRSQPSEIADYQGRSDKIAGKADKLFVEVPHGKHEYTFEILNDGHSALLRFFIPRKALTNNL
jgi:hypothetical protein